MSAAQVKEAAEKQGVTEDQYLEFNRVKAARGSAECRKLRQKNCASIAQSPDIRTGNARHPSTGLRRVTLRKVRVLPKKSIHDGVHPRQGLTLPRGPVEILYLIPGHEVQKLFRRLWRKFRKRDPKVRISCLPVTTARRWSRTDLLRTWRWTMMSSTRWMR